MSKAKKLLPPVHPGEILREEFMVPVELSMNKLALDLHVAIGAIFQHELGLLVEFAVSIRFGSRRG